MQEIARLPGESLGAQLESALDVIVANAIRARTPDLSREYAVMVTKGTIEEKASACGITSVPYYTQCLGCEAHAIVAIPYEIPQYGDVDRFGRPAEILSTNPDRFRRSLEGVAGGWRLPTLAEVLGVLAKHREFAYLQNFRIVCSDRSTYAIHEAGDGRLTLALEFALGIKRTHPFFLVRDVDD
jgi:hypothetical protein